MKNKFISLLSIATLFVLGACLSSSDSGGGGSDAATTSSFSALSASCNGCSSSHVQANVYANNTTALGVQESSSSACSAIMDAIASGNFQDNFVVRNSGATESCSPLNSGGASLGGCVQSPRFNIWKNSDNEFVTEIEDGNYVVVFIFKDDNGFDDPNPGDNILCSEFVNNEDDSSDDENLDLDGDDEFSIPWEYAVFPTLQAECTQSDAPGQSSSGDIDCNGGKDSGTTHFALFQDMTCSQLQTEVENGLISSDEEWNSSTSTNCDFVTQALSENSLAGGPALCDTTVIGGGPVASGVRGGSSLLAGSYAFLTIVAESDPPVCAQGTKGCVCSEAGCLLSGSLPIPTQGDLIQCQEIDLEVASSELQGINADYVNGDNEILAINWPNQIAIPSLELSCTLDNATRGPSPACNMDHDGNNVIVGYLKDMTCSALRTGIENESLDNLAFHAQSFGNLVCGPPLSNAGGVSSCVAYPEGDLNAGRTGVPPYFDQFYGQESGPITHIAEGNYAVIGLVDQFSDLEDTNGPMPGDVVFCREISLSATHAQGGAQYALDDSDAQSVNYTTFLPVDLSAQCTTSGAGQNCTSSADDNPANFVYAFNLSCSQLLTTPNFTSLAFANEDAVCQSQCTLGSCDHTCQVSIDAQDWAEDDGVRGGGGGSDPIYLPKGQYAIAGYIDNPVPEVLGQGEEEGGPGAEDVVWCQDYSNLDSSTSSFSMTDSDILSTGQMLIDFHAR